MAYNNPFWDFVRDINASAGQQAPHAESQPHPQQPRSGPEPVGFPFGGQGFEAFAPFLFGAGGPGPHHHAGPGRERRGGRGCPRGECPRQPEDGSEGEHAQRHAGPHGFHGHGHRGPYGSGRRGPPQFAFNQAEAPFDFAALISSLANGPLAAALRSCVKEAAGSTEQGSDPNVAPANTASETQGVKEKETDANDVDTFTPAVDIFSTPTEYVLHVALPGAKKEDVGVNWDAETGEVSVAGVVYRGGDEAFLKGLRREERRVGVFERRVKLPLEDEKAEVDEEKVAARLEDGVLVVSVGKREKEEKWTEVRRVVVE